MSICETSWRRAIEREGIKCSLLLTLSLSSSKLIRKTKLNSNTANASEKENFIQGYSFIDIFLVFLSRVVSLQVFFNYAHQRLTPTMMGSFMSHTTRASTMIIAAEALAKLPFVFLRIHEQLIMWRKFWVFRWGSENSSKDETDIIRHEPWYSAPRCDCLVVGN